MTLSRSDVHVFWVGCGCLLLLLLAGCSTPSPRSRYLEQIEPGSLTNLTAFRSGTNLQLRFALRGKDLLARANWGRRPGGATDYQHEFAALTFERKANPLLNANFRPGQRLTVRDTKQWEELVHSVFQDLVPTAPGHGVLLLVGNHEVVVFRDAGAKLNVFNLENKPPEIVLDHTYNDADFSREAIRILTNRMQALDPSQAEFLFITGEDPAFVLIDLRERLMVFLSYPSDPEAQATKVPGWFALRALNALFIKSLLITAVKNPVTLVARGFWHLGSSGATMFQAGSAAPTDPPPPLCAGPGMDLAAWEARLDQLVAARRYRGGVDLFIDGEKFFPALIQSVEEARRSVDVAVYIFDTDEYAVKIADLLKRRSTNVTVRVLIDELGSLFASEDSSDAPTTMDFEPPDDIQSYLTSGSRVRVRSASNPWLTGNHRKCIIIDDRQAYVGGMNIGREYRFEWHDMMVRLTGPIVGRLELEYRDAWAHAGPLGDFAYGWSWIFGRIQPVRTEKAEGIEIRPLRTATGKLEIYSAQLAAIQRARRYIYIENAYFDDDTIVRELIRARHRGVDVRVILPADNNSSIMQTGNQVIANRMVEQGIRVYAYPGMSHVKAAIYDGWACLGSANFDKMSLRISQELDVSFSDPATVDRLDRELFEKDFARSREQKTPVPLSWLDFLVKALADQL